MNARPQAAALVLLLLLPSLASAFDLGDPTFPKLHEPGSRFEITYHSLERDVWLSFDRPRLLPAGSSVIGVATAEPARVRTMFDATMMVGRWVYHPLEYVSTQFDLGLSGESTGDDTAIVLGGAARILLTESGPFQLVAQFDAHVLPESRTFESGFNPVAGDYNAFGDIDAYQYGTALMASYSVATGNGTTTNFYFGPRLSAFRSEVSSYANFANGDRLWVDAIAKQANLFGVVLGARNQWDETWSARLEGRLSDERSISVGLSASF